MMLGSKNNKKKEVDIINDVLEQCILAYPVSSFIISLYKQYQQRGSLSKKQLQGLHSKASQIKDFPQNKLATIEAIIKKMPTRNKSELPENKPVIDRNENSATIIEAILTKYPQHKRFLFFKSKHDKNELTPQEIAEIKKFEKLLL